MIEFIVNDFITLRLENRKTEIYVLDEKFIQCKFLLMKIPFEEIASLNEIKSIDEAEEKLNRSLETTDPKKYMVDSKTEFWAHCSNLQVWTEHKYLTKLLHRNISFPLLKKLTEKDDQIAKKVFKEEIAKRMEEGNLNVALYLLEERYLEYLTEEEKELVYYDSNNKLKENLEQALNKQVCSSKTTLFLSEELAILTEKLGQQIVSEDFTKTINKRLKEGNLKTAVNLLGRKIWDMVSKKEIEYSFYEEYEKSRKFIEKILKEADSICKVALLVLKDLAELVDETARQRSIEEFERELKRKHISEYQLLVMEGYPYDGINWTRYYEYLDRNTVLYLLLEESDAEAILELDKLIEKRWIKFKSNLHYEEDEYSDNFRRKFLTLRPTDFIGEKFEDRENYTFLIEERRVVDIFLSSEAKFRLLEFPEPILKLTALRKLNLEYNRILEIPEGLSALKELQTLNLSRCNTQSLPESIGELKLLEKIDLGSCKIEILPPSFSDLVSLKSLDLSNNKLMVFPNEICSLESMKNLKLYGNKLRTLPKSISQLKSLELILLFDNNLLSLPDEIENMESLTSMDISRNKLESLPKTILNMVNLNRITIDVSQRNLYPLKELKKKRKGIHIILQ